jgi:hypothetical protein
MGGVSLPLENWRVVVTGDVPGMSRDAAQDAVRGMGGTAVVIVNATVDLLVVGRGAGAAKLAKAATLGLRQLPAGEFAELAENPDRWDGRPLGSVPDPAAELAAAPPPRGREEPPPASEHPAGLTTWTRDGRWTVVARCRCGHGSEGSSAAEAEAGHRRHRVEVGDLVAG